MSLPLTAKPAPGHKAQMAWLLLTLVVLHFCLFDGLRAIGLVGPDEPRYAAVAREMAESGDWVTPRLHGQPWFEKPALYYWAAAVRYRLWGDSEFSARAPSATAAAATTLLLGWLAWRTYGWRAAAAFVVLFPTTVAAIGFGRAAAIDMVFTATLALVMTAAARVVKPELRPADSDETVYGGAKAPPRRRMLAAKLWQCAFGAGLGLAVLAKGPVAIVLAGGAVGAWVIATQRWRAALRLAHPLAVLAFALVALPWYLLCAARNPQFVDVFLISHNIDRFFTPVFRHEQPFWFFGPILLLGLLPWTLLLAGPLRDGWTAIKNREWKESASLFFVCWAIVPIVFFSLSKSKLPGYVLPAVPPLVLLMAYSLTRAIDEELRAARWLLTGCAAALLILGVVAAWPQTFARMPEGSPIAMRVLAGLAGAGAVAVTYFAWRDKAWWAVAAAALTVAVLIAGTTRTLLPQMDSQRSPRQAAARVAAHARPQRVAVYQVHRAWHYGLNYYLRRDLPVWLPQANSELIVTSEAGLLDLQARGAVGELVERVAPNAILVRPKQE